jgi:hypothetical protein
VSPSLEFLERCASETGFRVSALEKVAGLGGLAGDITRHPLLGKALALKGGTALNLFRKLFIALSVVLDHPLSTYSRSLLERLVTDRVLMDQLAPLLNAEIELRVGDLIEKAWAVVIRFFDLSAEEKDYLESAGRGDLRMGLLFPGDAQEAMRVAAHPAIQWKISNVKVHAAKSKRGA